MQDSDLMNAREMAMHFARQGWPVFPCNPEDKSPLTPKGFKNASLEDHQVARWWQKHPAAMVGIPTGDPLGGIFVLDINPPAGKNLIHCAQEIAMAIGQSLPNTRTTITPNGWHLWYEAPDGILIKNRGPLVGGHIDCVRGTGGYVIGPGSRNAEGKRYLWADATVPIAMAPSALLALVKK